MRVRVWFGPVSKGPMNEVTSRAVEVEAKGVDNLQLARLCDALERVADAYVQGETAKARAAEARAVRRGA